MGHPATPPSLRLAIKSSIRTRDQTGVLAPHPTARRPQSASLCARVRAWDQNHLANVCVHEALPGQTHVAPSGATVVPVADCTLCRRWTGGCRVPGVIAPGPKYVTKTNARHLKVPFCCVHLRAAKTHPKLRCWHAWPASAWQHLFASLAVPPCQGLQPGKSTYPCLPPAAPLACSISGLALARIGRGGCPDLSGAWRALEKKVVAPMSRLHADAALPTRFNGLRCVAQNNQRTCHQLKQPVSAFSAWADLQAVPGVALPPRHLGAGPLI